MKDCTRRHFITSSFAGATALLAARRMAEAVEVPEGSLGGGSATDRVPLGKSGVVVSRLAQGTGVHGGNRASDHTRMGQEAFNRIIFRGLDHGINFFDMADLYGTHPFMRKALKEVPREDCVLLSKIWTRDASWVNPSGGAKEEVNRFCKELGTDRLDICLIHCMTDSQWPDTEKRVRDELSELKQSGQIRATGVSCHDHGALKIAAQDPWVDVIFARINYMGGSKYKMDGTAKEIAATLKKARENGKAVVGMKIFGEGSLIESDQKDASLRFVLGNHLVDAMTIGMRKPEEVDDSVARITKTLRG